MTGFHLNSQLTDLGAKFASRVLTAPSYRLYDLGPKPALIRQSEDEDGFAIELEVWELPVENVGRFMRYVKITFVSNCSKNCPTLGAILLSCSAKRALAAATSSNGSDWR
jgi:hypothetical protein